MNWGRRVVLPLPVDPRTTTTELFSMKETSWGGNKDEWTAGCTERYISVSFDYDAHFSFWHVVNEWKGTDVKWNVYMVQIWWIIPLFCFWWWASLGTYCQGAEPVVDLQLNKRLHQTVTTERMKGGEKQQEDRMRRGVDFNSPLPGSVFRLVTPDFTSFFLVSAFDGLHT